MSEKGFWDIIRIMALLWEQRSLCKSFAAYFFAPEIMKNYQDSIKNNLKRIDNPEIVKVIKDVYSQHINESSNNSNSRSIKEFNLIGYHWGYRLAWWRFFEKRKRQKFMREDALLVQHSQEPVKNTLEMCKKNKFLVPEEGREGYVCLSVKGDRLRYFSGWIEEVFIHYGKTRSVLLALVLGLIGSPILESLARVIYHHFFP